MTELTEEVSADTALGKYRYKGNNLNTIATVLILICVVVIGAGLWMHMGDQKDANRAMKELTSALRENNCLQRGPREDRSHAEFCKQISQQFVY